VPEYQTQFGIYEPNCGLENVRMSFGHDGYIAEIMKPYLRDEALYILRFHSFYAWRRHGSYTHLTNVQLPCNAPAVLILSLQQASR